MKNAAVTKACDVFLEEVLPWANLEEFEKNPRVQDFGNLLTVGDLCNYVGSKVGE